MLRILGNGKMQGISKGIKGFILLSFLLAPIVCFAGRGCCSWHSGVAGCDGNVGKLVCNDGTYSPSCRCPLSNNFASNSNQVGGFDTTDGMANYCASSVTSDMNVCIAYMHGLGDGLMFGNQVFGKSGISINFTDKGRNATNGDLMRNFLSYINKNNRERQNYLATVMMRSMLEANTLTVSNKKISDKLLLLLSK